MTAYIDAIANPKKMTEQISTHFPNSKISEIQWVPEMTMHIRRHGDGERNSDVTPAHLTLEIQSKEEHPTGEDWLLVLKETRAFFESSSLLVFGRNAKVVGHRLQYSDLESEITRAEAWVERSPYTKYLREILKVDFIIEYI